MKIPTKLVSAAAVAAVTLMSAGCGGSTTPVETFAEAEDPVAADSTAWESVKKGLNAMWGSTDCLYSRSVPPASQDAPKSIRLTAWRGERVSAQAVLWSASGAQSVVCATDDFTSDGATLPAGIATARFVRYTIADKSDPKCVCPRPQNHPAVLQPDMLDSLDRFDMAARTTRPVWITVNVPADAPAGIYRSQITVTRGDGCGKIRLPFELEVQDRLLPPPTEWRYHLDLWQHPAAVARAEGVELKTDRTDLQFTPEAREHHDHFGVDVWTRHPERFGAQLMELTIAAALRTLMAEHRSEVPKALRGAVQKIVLVHRADYRRRAFRTKRELVTVHRIGEGIHFLFDDVGHFAHAARKDARVLKNRRADLLIAVALKHVDGRRLNILPNRSVLRKHVVHALDAGKFFFSHDFDEMGAAARDAAHGIAGPGTYRP